MSNRQDDALPELPEPNRDQRHLGFDSWETFEWYSADQMRAYAQSAIASLQARLDAAEADAALWRAHVSYAADGHSHLCRRCGHAYTPTGNEDCPKCGHDGRAA